MATKATKRRAWTPEHLRTLKALARKKTHAARIAKTLKLQRVRPGKKHLVWVYRWIRGFEFVLSADKFSPNEPRQLRGFFCF